MIYVTQTQPGDALLRVIYGFASYCPNICRIDVTLHVVYFERRGTTRHKWRRETVWMSRERAFRGVAKPEVPKDVVEAALRQVRENVTYKENEE